MTSTNDIRRWATAFPEVEETEHFRFHVPLFKVRGRTFVGMGQDSTTAVFCIAEQEAYDLAASDPDTYDALRRPDARKSFLGLQVRLADVAANRVRSLVAEAWRAQAPKRLVAEHDRRDRGAADSVPKR